MATAFNTIVANATSVGAFLSAIAVVDSAFIHDVVITVAVSLQAIVTTSAVVAVFLAFLAVVVATAVVAAVVAANILVVVFVMWRLLSKLL